MKKHLLVILLTFSIALSILACCGCSSASIESVAFEPLAEVSYPAAYAFDDFDAWKKIVVDNKVSSSFIQAQRAFSFKIATLLLDAESVNANCSPLSIYMALAMASTGADGQTQEQMLTLLGMQDVEELSLQCGNLYRLLYTDNEMTQLKLANSLWLSRDADIKDTFVKQAADAFYTSSYKVDFGDPSTGQAMGQWISEMTQGTLAPELKTDSTWILSMINTLYFNDEWDVPFDEEKTAQGVFHAPDGDVQFDFMNGRSGGEFAKTQQYTRASLVLKSRAKIIFILPNQGISPSDLISTADGIEALFGSAEDQGATLTLKIPKFEIDSEFELADDLKKLGMTQAFEPQADFSNIIDGMVFISEVTHQTHIALNEKGVEASAFTMISLMGNDGYSNEFEMILDRPFIYAITAQNGAILFMGICNNPVSG